MFLKGRGVYTVSFAKTKKENKTVFVDRSINKVVNDSNTTINDKQITSIFKNTKMDTITPVKFEKAKQLRVEVPAEFKSLLKRHETNHTMQAWRFIQNNIHKFLPNFRPSTISWDGFYNIAGIDYYADIKYYGKINLNTRNGQDKLKALQNGWIQVSVKQSLKMNPKTLGITPIVLVYVILQEKGKNDIHKVFQLNDKDLKKNVDQDATKTEMASPPTTTPPPKKRKRD